ncbi:hypothetical protein RB599_000364 [Gaeumannomyces hyphopodioides]
MAYERSAIPPTLTSTNDSSLGNLLAQLPQHCVVLLEDVDAASCNRQDRKAEDSEFSLRRSQTQKGGVTLSEPLNALDGVASQEGRVLIMTTNYIERLDDALIRPGRVDRKVEFRLAGKDIVGRLFRIVFKNSNGMANETAEKLAADFVGQVPESEFSPAELLSLLIQHRLSPADAVANVQGWMARLREERRTKLKREDS